MTSQENGKNGNKNLEEKIILVREQENMEDEIDLYEIVHTIVKNIKTVIRTTILSFIFLAGLSVFYLKFTQKEYIAKKIVIENIASSLLPSNVINIENIFYNNKNVNQILSTPEIKKMYDEKVTEKNNDSKMKFVNELYDVTSEKNENGKQEYIIKTEVLDDEKISNDLINNYVALLKVQDKLNENVKKKKKEIENLKNEILSEVVMVINDANKDSTVTLEYQLGTLDRLNEITLELEKLSNLNQITETTDIYAVKQKSKTLLFIAISVILSGFIGLASAFIKEFIDEYRKKYAK